MKNIFKLLIISVLCLSFMGCKSSSDTTKKQKKEKKARTDSTDDVVEEQRQDYEEAMKQL